MLKLLLCLIAAFLTAIVVLELRQQRLNLNFQANRLHNEIEKRQAKLWSQQLQIAGYTAPNAIAKTIGNTKLELTPQGSAPASAANWMGKTGDTGVVGQ
jgi:cell division protein FtsL